MPSPQIYRVSPNEEINEILRAVKEARGQSLSLVLPKNALLFRNEVNLRLLTAYAREASVQVALVTEDLVTRRRAARHGIPIHETPEGPLARRNGNLHTERLEEAEDHEGIEPAVPRHQPWPRRLMALLVAGGALAGLLFTLTPKVHIAVTPHYEHLQFVTLIELADPSVFSLLAFDESLVTASVTVPTAGVQRVGVSHAEGTVVLLNSSEQPVHVPAGTQLATQSGLLFRTTAHVTIPGREVSYFLDVPVGVQSGRAEVRVSAVEPGSQGNVGAERIRILHGDWPTLTVRNLEPLVGGTDATVPAVAASDLEFARQQATLALERERSHRIEQTAQSRPSLSLLDLEWEAGDRVVFSHGVGEMTSEVEASIQGTLRTVWADANDFQHYVARTIPERVPIGYTWEQAKWFAVSIEGYDAHEGLLRLQADVPLRPNIDAVKLARTVAGQRTSEAIAQLQGRDGIASAVIRPERTERLPTWAPWIRVQVEDPTF